MDTHASPTKHDTTKLWEIIKDIKFAMFTADRKSVV